MEPKSLPQMNIWKYHTKGNTFSIFAKDDLDDISVLEDMITDFKNDIIDDFVRKRLDCSVTFSYDDIMDILKNVQREY